MGHGPNNQSNNEAEFYETLEYRKNGYDFISGNGGRNSVYKRDNYIQKTLRARGIKPRKKGVSPASKEHAAAYHFAYGNNFKIGRSPYVNQGHHMVPQSFLNLFNDDKCRQIAKKIEYTINRGENIVFLPTNVENTEFHSIPYHLGSHNDYNNMVLSAAKDIENKLRQYASEEPCKPEDDLPEDILKKFENLENDLWRLITKAGSVSINEVCIPKKKGKKKKK